MKHIRLVFLLFFFLLLVLTGFSVDPSAYAGAPGEPIIDSRMTREEAFDGLDETCPADIRARQKVVTVTYYSFDRKVHEGQLVIDSEVADDVRTVFEVALRERFPISSVIPISDKRFRKNGRWDDDLSMAANNTSAFNYRVITGGTRLSKHAYGRAIDINPFLNPYIKGTTILPPGSAYDPNIAGTLTADHPIVRTFVGLGWEWGGDWTSLKDYQHFEKPLKE